MKQTCKMASLLQKTVCMCGGSGSWTLWRRYEDVTAWNMEGSPWNVGLNNWTQQTVLCNKGWGRLYVNANTVDRWGLCSSWMFSSSSWYLVADFLVIKPTRCTNFSNLFWNETLHVSDSSSVHHQELSTVHSAVVRHTCLYIAFEQEQDEYWSCLKAIYKPVWHISLLNVQWINPDDGQMNCPKHVEFHSKMNLRNIYLVLL
jgi:hypothetical protein